MARDRYPGMYPVESLIAALEGVDCPKCKNTRYAESGLGMCELCTAAAVRGMDLAWTELRSLIPAPSTA